MTILDNQRPQSNVECLPNDLVDRPHEAESGILFLCISEVVSLLPILLQLLECQPMMLSSGALISGLPDTHGGDPIYFPCIPSRVVLERRV